MPKLEQNPYLVSFRTAFGTTEEENIFFNHRHIREFLLAVGFSSEDVKYIIETLEIELTEDICHLRKDDLDDLPNLSLEGKIRLQEIILWARKNAKYIERKIAVLDRLHQNYKGMFKEIAKNPDKV